MKFADGFDTEREDETCPKGMKVVSVPTQKGSRIVSVLVNGTNSCLKIYVEDGSFYSMPLPKPKRKTVAKLK